MECSINFLDEVVEGHRRATIMTLVVSVILHGIDVTSRLIFIPMGVPTDGAPEVIKVGFDSLELLESS